MCPSRRTSVLLCEFPLLPGLLRPQEEKVSRKSCSATCSKAYLCHRRPANLYPVSLDEARPLFNQNDFPTSLSTSERATIMWTCRTSHFSSWVLLGGADSIALRPYSLK
eukprot:TRINITY_DN383_c0_g1::TRINITY_DN383_c0_g1_i1::g.7568::m.7568 TRINITY_DN383_c0_g1::TRINITY_DN383_c0_g1_i1::g.7568  ORF type:complete len:109 (-),score=-8.22,gag_pre-integrs/PF13976.1/34,gag_pre-integrs/PF13976.1/3.1 TRINITY_DN383_c0_g1_i1:988-1314(-)